ncbi:MAG TPA: hypothetical protein VMW69_00935 [Spirochaetia bacterium]|nr:hypothetical protein [Spirochaetia bacterium]
MSAHSEARLLASEIAKNRTILKGLYEELSEALLQDLPKLGRSQRAAIMVAGIVESYYTCAETVFLRISQFFENNLRPDRWHTDLLDHMTLEVSEVRPRVISSDTFSDLSELMRFRHFKRYYFSLAYDWERLDAIVHRLQRVHPNLDTELQDFELLARDL